MGSVRTRSDNAQLFLDFRYLGMRCRERSVLHDTKQNRLKLEALLRQIESEINSGSFRYRNYFPNSNLVEKIEQLEATHFYQPTAASVDLAQPQNYPPPANALQNWHPTFADFARKFVEENESIWKRSNIRTKRDILEKWLIPQFGNKVISSITKQDLLEFRSVLAKAPGKRPGTTMSASRINHVMTSAKQVLDEAADRFNFTTPYMNIKRMRIKKTDVTPFTIEEVESIIRYCRPDFRNYFVAKFFTGMRPGEVHGLKWKYVDFAKRTIAIRETIVDDYEETPKTADSNRDIQMVPQVYEALKEQWQVTGNRSEFVFANSNGNPLANRNLANRVWYPMLRSLNMKPRTPYQTRHTFATLMLAAGESPEWIAFQMGHSSTEMLFKVYSRYVPNLTRRDGSAFERMLAANLGPVSNPLLVEPEPEPKSPKRADPDDAKQVSATTQPTELPLVETPLVRDQSPNQPPTKVVSKNPWLEMFESYNNKNELGE